MLSLITRLEFQRFLAWINLFIMQGSHRLEKSGKTGKIFILLPCTGKLREFGFWGFLEEKQGKLREFHDTQGKIRENVLRQTFCNIFSNSSILLTNHEYMYFIIVSIMMVYKMDFLVWIFLEGALHFLNGSRGKTS